MESAMLGTSYHLNNITILAGHLLSSEYGPAPGQLPSEPRAGHFASLPDWLAATFTVTPLLSPQSRSLYHNPAIKKLKLDLEVLKQSGAQRPESPALEVLRQWSTEASLLHWKSSGRVEQRGQSPAMNLDQWSSKVPTFTKDSPHLFLAALRSHVQLPPSPPPCPGRLLTLLVSLRALQFLSQATISGQVPLPLPRNAHILSMCQVGMVARVCVAGQTPVSHSILVKTQAEDPELNYFLTRGVSEAEADAEPQ
ncbi:hypothetical protein O3P69_001250 [Scylla paramamosain]|uniref:Uncharacterized protein n=1 Tax=Scylla paramamosain TaxID=85552 RepID=A0AAW0UQK1_SCYPA